VIDWAGLQNINDEWAGLWQINNVRLSKQVFDACTIAKSRGWRICVIGPVPPAEAPLFAMIAASVEMVSSVRAESREAG